MFIHEYHKNAMPFSGKLARWQFKHRIAHQRVLEELDGPLGGSSACCIGRNILNVHEL